MIVVSFLPISLTHLIFGCVFDKPINNMLPKSLIYLKLGYAFNQPIGNVLLSPTNIEYLKLGANINILHDYIFPSLKKLVLMRLDEGIINLPQSFLKIQIKHKQLTSIVTFNVSKTCTINCDNEINKQFININRIYD